jgi:hypothetical protein
MTWIDRDGFSINFEVRGGAPLFEAGGLGPLWGPQCISLETCHQRSHFTKFCRYKWGTIYRVTQYFNFFGLRYLPLIEISIFYTQFEKLNCQTYIWTYDVNVCVIIRTWVFCDWFIIYGFTFCSRIFHLHGDVTIVCEGLQILGLCSALRAFEQGGIIIAPHLLWHGTSVFPVSSEEPPHWVASYDTRGGGGDLL